MKSCQAHGSGKCGEWGKLQMENAAMPIVSWLAVAA
jgi:hypothetical protein